MPPTSARATPSGHDLDARTDQRGELRSSAESAQPHASAARLASVDRIRIYVTYSPAVATIGDRELTEPDPQGRHRRHVEDERRCWGPAQHHGRVGDDGREQAPPPLVKPQIDLDWWWRNAKPGPMYPCTEAGNTFPNGFDTNAGATAGNAFAPDNSVSTSAEITPMNSSYTCQVKENGVLKGEISWNMRPTR